MRLPRLVLVPLLGLLAIAVLGPASRPAARAAPRVYGGDRTSTRLHPWMVALSHRPQPWPLFGAPRSGQFCGGAVTRRRFVVTAAHCVTTRALDPESGKAVKRDRPLFVIAGRDDLRLPTGRIAEVTRTWVHPDYDPRTLAADLALLTLDRALPRSLELAEPGDTELDAPGALAVLLGYGYDSEQAAADLDEPQPYLRRARIPVRPDADCQHPTITHKEQIPRKFQPRVMLCAGGTDRRTGIGACEGDSGGPLVIDGRLAGVVSHSQADSCAQPDRPSVFTRVTAYAADLRQEIRRRCSSRPQVRRLRSSARSSPRPASAAGVSPGNLKEPGQLMVTR